jgi:hypothetical protein
LFADQRKHCADRYEKWEQRQYCHVGQIAGVDKSVIIGPGPDSRDHPESACLPESTFGSDMVVISILQPIGALAPRFGRQVGDRQRR